MTHKITIQCNLINVNRNVNHWLLYECSNRIKKGKEEKEEKRYRLFATGWVKILKPLMRQYNVKTETIDRTANDVDAIRMISNVNYNVLLDSIIVRNKYDMGIRLYFSKSK